MTKATFKKVNAALKDAGLDVELVKGEGYFYFAGEGTDGWASTGVYVYRLTDLTVEEWMEEAREKETRTW